MGSKMAPPYANLSIGFLEETKLYPQLPRLFSSTTVELLIRWFLRYIDDGFILWPKGEPIEAFINLLNNLNQSIKFTLVKSKKYYNKDGDLIQELAFLDVLVIVINYKKFTTDIFYKETNSHFYLDYRSHHPTHIKDNIPYGLAKKLIAFVPDYDRLEYRLEQLKTWLIKRNYPLDIINRKIHNARLEGPAPPPSPNDISNNKLIFTTTYTSNFSHKNTVEQINSIFHLPRTERIQTVFGNCKTMLAYRQPKNLLRHITQASFSSIPRSPTNLRRQGLFHCSDKKCKLCRLYIQECNSFITHNGTEWKIKSDIHCNSTNVLYFLKCKKCPDQERPVSNTGKTFTRMRERMNNHITSCRLGGSTDLFDEHVFKCKQNSSNPDEEPYFHIYAFMTVKRRESLLTYVNHLHQRGFYSINSPS